MNLTVDVLVIGFGTAGKLIAAAMGRSGARVVMVEQSDQMYGGTCINIGCVPTKSFVHLAETRDPQRDPDDSFRDANLRTKNLTSQMRQRNFANLNAIDTVTLITGRASFLDPHNVVITTGGDSLIVTADVIIIDTGSEPVVPDIPGVGSSVHVYTSTGLLADAERPARLAVIGGGNVGVEFASFYSQFGSTVTILEESDTLFGHEDDDVAAEASDLLKQTGVCIRTGAIVTHIVDHSHSATIHHTTGDAARSLEVDAILIAVGRVPAVQDLHLSNAQIKTTSRGAIAVDEHLRTSQSHVFAVGDANGGPQFTYISHDDSRIVLDHLIGSSRRSTADRQAVAHTVFLSPPLSRVGITERQAVLEGRSVDVAIKRISDLAAMPRAEILGETRGLMKFVIDTETDAILGATLFCVDSQELINLVALAMRTGVNATTLRDTIFTHPTSSEAIGEVLHARQPTRANYPTGLMQASSKRSVGVLQ